MKKIFAAALALVLNISCTAQDKFSKEALTSKLNDINNKEVTFKEILKKHKGKVTVIEVWASWCSDCVKNMPNLKTLQAENPTVDFVFLSCDKTTEAWIKGIEKHELTGDQYLIPGGMKGAFGKSIKVDWIPRYIIIDKNGKIALFRAIETDHEKVKELLKKLSE